LKYENSSLIHIQTKDNFVILTHKTDTLITLTTFLKKCEKDNGCLHYGTEWVYEKLNSSISNVLNVSIFIKTYYLKVVKEHSKDTRQHFL